MFEWLGQCLGGNHEKISFQEIRQKCTSSDWSVPDAHTLTIFMKTFRGKGQGTSPDAAINSLLAHLQQDDRRLNGAYLLKNLMLLDFLVEERLYLSKIGNYYSNQLLDLPTHGQFLNSWIKELIGTYYVYIKEKSKLYMRQTIDLANKNTRMQFLKKASIKSIFTEINICFKIHSLIIDVGQKASGRIKAGQLINMIFTCLLKTILFCYSIVSLGIRTMISRIFELDHSDIKELGKLLTFIEKDYTRGLIAFILRNRHIASFRQIDEKELVILNEENFQFLRQNLNRLCKLNGKEKQSFCVIPIVEKLVKRPAIKLSVDRKEKEQDSDKDTQLTAKEKQEMHTLLLGKPQKYKIGEQFSDCKNCYSDMMLEDESTYSTLKSNSRAKTKLRTQTCDSDHTDHFQFPGSKDKLKGSFMEWDKEPANH